MDKSHVICTKANTTHCVATASPAGPDISISEDGEAPQQVFIGYNGNVWLWFSLSHSLSLSDTDDQQNCALRNLERSLSFMERNKTGPKTEAWEIICREFTHFHSLKRLWSTLLVLPQVVCVNCKRVFVLTDRQGPSEAALINSLKHQLLDVLAIRACVRVLGLFIKVFGP